MVIVGVAVKRLILPLILAVFLGGCAGAPTGEPHITDETADRFVSVTDTERSAEISTETSEFVDFSDAIAEETISAEDADVETEAIPAETEPAETEPIPEKGYVYITFDDGPGRYTERVLEILANYDVKATFFLVGSYIEKYPEYAKAIYDAGHDIGCHSATHAYRDIYASGDTMTADILAWERIVEAAIGCVPEERLYRYPGGSNCTAIEEGIFPELHLAQTSLGYRAFDWNCANNDRWLVDKGEDQSMDDFLKESVINSLARCRGTQIMLLHETSHDTVDMLEWLIEYLYSEGYGIAPLSKFDGEYLFAH